MECSGAILSLICLLVLLAIEMGQFYVFRLRHLKRLDTCLKGIVSDRFFVSMVLHRFVLPELNHMVVHLN